jgi:hypothetical protein
MTNTKQVAVKAGNSFLDPGGGVRRLQAANGGETGERITGAPEGFCRLARPQLAAVPDFLGSNAAADRFRREDLGLLDAA